MTSLRVGWAGFADHFKQLSRSPFDLLVSAVWPLVNATLAYFVHR